jgi:hypothetical protein
MATAARVTKSYSMFGLHPMHGPHLDSETVREIGHGDLKAGHAVLHKFVMKFGAKRARDAKASYHR